ncbi:MAG TPA: transcriptional regulator, partial [Thermodesulfobacteriota bacterium]|nr:transcriptional regulator [Thermodesulfobacteriota bacterium]
LLFMKGRDGARVPPCWDVLKCPRETKDACPAWEFQAGQFCWFINGTVCGGKARASWREKMKACRRCRVFAAALKL